MRAGFAEGTGLAPADGVRLALLPIVALLACGPAESDDTLLPLVPGATWDYRTADAVGAPGARTVRVLRVDGDAALLETRENGLVETTWLRNDQVVLALTHGAEAPLEIEASWEREGRETITIEAGIFETVRIRRTQSDGDDALLWYAPGIGLMRAEGTNESLELVHWVIP